MREKVRGIVFDLDDTLYPQIEFKRSGFSAAARALAASGIAGEAVLLDALAGAMEEAGPSHPRLFDSALAGLGLPLNLVPEMVRVFRAHTPEITLYPGVAKLLMRLGSRYKLGLLTDGIASVQRNKVAALGIGNLFDAAVYSDDLGTCKPDPLLFRRFEEEFGLPGASLVHVADNPAKDFEGARGRGWLTVRVLSGEHRFAEAAPGMDADISIDSMALLLKRLI